MSIKEVLDWEHHPGWIKVGLSVTVHASPEGKGACHPEGCKAHHLVKTVWMPGIPPSNSSYELTRPVPPEDSLLEGSLGATPCGYEVLVGGDNAFNVCLDFGHFEESAYGRSVAVGSDAWKEMYEAGDDMVAELLACGWYYRDDDEGGICDCGVYERESSP